MTKGIVRRTLVYGDATLMTEFVLKEGSEIKPHKHIYEQTGFLVSGLMVLTIGDEVFEVRPGDSWAIPSNIEHHSKILADSVVIEVFSPRREDYMPK